MGKVLTYRNEGSKGMFCQIKYESGERILVSIDRRRAKIYRLGFYGWVATKTIWESKDILGTAGLFRDPNKPDRNLLDSIVARLVDCRDLDCVKQKLNM